MNIKIFIALFLILPSIVSCERRYNLSEKDYKWMPYKGNEILVFESRTGETDTIFFVRKDTLFAYPEAQNPFGSTYQEVSIACKHSDPSPPDGEHRYLENYCFTIGKSKDKKTRLSIGLLAKDAVFYRMGGIRIDSLSEITAMTLQTKSRTYNDVYAVDDEDWLNFKQRSNYVTKLYWSKSEGLVRYDKQNGDVWELEKKYNH